MIDSKLFDFCIFYTPRIRSLINADCKPIKRSLHGKRKNVEPLKMAAFIHIHTMKRTRSRWIERGIGNRYRLFVINKDKFSILSTEEPIEMETSIWEKVKVSGPLISTQRSEIHQHQSLYGALYFSRKKEKKTEKKEKLNLSTFMCLVGGKKFK